MRRTWLVFIFLLFLLVTIVHFHVFDFTFWKDDWGSIWALKNNLNLFSVTWLHPATSAEFILLRYVFNNNIFAAQLLGICIKVIASVCTGLFIGKLTKSKKAGVLSLILFSISFAGVDAVAWVSAHVVNVATVFICICLVSWIQLLQVPRKKSFIIFLSTLSVAILSDPWRVLPIFFILFLLTYFFGSPMVGKRSRFSLLVLFLLTLFSLPILVVWHSITVTDAQLLKFFSLAVANPMLIFDKFYVIGNYFNSITNLNISWFIPLFENGSTGLYSPFLARLGLIPLFLFTYASIRAYTKKSKFLSIVSFFLFWIYLFYIPNWLFEPRLTMGGSHRYLAISNVGFIGLVAYLLSRMENKVLSAGLAVLFIFFNVLSVQRFYTQQAVYRSRDRVERFWKTISDSVPDPIGNRVFMYLGEDPIKTYALGLSGAMPFAIIRNLQTVPELPIVSDSYEEIVPLICEKNIQRKFHGIEYVIADPLPLSHIHAWLVKNDGTIIDVSSSQRAKLLYLANMKGCTPTYDTKNTPSKEN